MPELKKDISFLTFDIFGLDVLQARKNFGVHIVVSRQKIQVNKKTKCQDCTRPSKLGSVQPAFGFLVNIEFCGSLLGGVCAHIGIVLKMCSVQNILQYTFFILLCKAFLPPHILTHKPQTHSARPYGNMIILPFLLFGVLKAQLCSPVKQHLLKDCVNNRDILSCLHRQKCALEKTDVLVFTDRQSCERNCLGISGLDFARYELKYLAKGNLILN